MKYAPDDYSFSIEEKEKLLRRIELFRSATGTRKGILPTLVTTFGLNLKIAVEVNGALARQPKLAG